MNKQNQIALKIATFSILFFGATLAIASLAMDKDPSKFVTKLIFISFLGILYGLLGAISYSIYNKEQVKVISLIAICVCIVGFLFSVFAIFAETKSQGFIKFLISLGILSIGLAQVSLLYKIDIVNKYAFLSRIIAVACISIVTLFLVALVLKSGEDFMYSLRMGDGITETGGRIYTSVLSFDFACTAATPLLNKFNIGKLEKENWEDEFLKDVPYESELETPVQHVNINEIL
jgi:hypothetical protein